MTFLNQKSMRFVSAGLAFAVFLCALLACGGRGTSQAMLSTKSNSKSALLLTGAQQPEAYLPLLQNKRVGLVLNQTAIYDSQTHLVDFLRQQNINITAIFVPEHGFRGTADAGMHVKNGQDPATGLPLLSLYGQNKKPSPEQMQKIDILLFDIQDVGVRFYTYISTLHYVMEACAENKKTLVVLDRPNPNGHYIDGPIRKAGLASFVGMHPIPIVHGLTVAELAQMINGEKWLPQGLECNLKLILCKNYTHQTRYVVPIKPSPNLKDSAAIWLYPSLCLFEGTPISVGRGTPLSFRVFGHPTLPKNTFYFVPKADEGNKKPMYEGLVCYGTDLSQRVKPPSSLELQHVMEAYSAFSKKDSFFLPFFDKLAGDTTMRLMIQKGETESAIRQSWQKELGLYKQMRQKYLLYPD